MLTLGLTKEKRMTVAEEQTAISMHSGGLQVFATPAMIALMEEAALECAADHLEPGMNDGLEPRSALIILPPPRSVQPYGRSHAVRNRQKAAGLFCRGL